MSDVLVQPVLSVQEALNLLYRNFQSGTFTISQGNIPATPIGLFASTGTFSRQADTTQYGANDSVASTSGSATALTFGNIVETAGDGGAIVKAVLITDQKTNVARFRLHLYTAAPTAFSDNVPFGLLWANRDKRIGHIDFSALAAEDSTASTAAQNLVVSGGGNLPLSFKSVDKNLYGLLETLDAFTPASGQSFWILLTSIRAQ